MKATHKPRRKRTYAVHYQALVSSVVYVKAESPEQAADFVHSKIDPGILLEHAVEGAVDEDAKILQVEIEHDPIARSCPDADATDPAQVKKAI